MQVNSRVIGILGWGIFGGLIMWLCSVTGWNNWGSTSTTSTVLNIAITVAIYGYLGYALTSSKSPGVRASTAVAFVLAGLALYWLSQALGITAWIQNSSVTWHAFVGGFISFAIGAVIVPYLPKRS